MNKECENIKDQIADYVSGVLTDSEAELLQQHLNECSTCNEYMRELKNEDKLLTALFAEIDTNMKNRQERTLKAINRSDQFGQNETTSIRKILMKNPITKLAAAAVIIAVFVLSIFEFSGTENTSGLAWGDVIKKVETSTGVIYRMRQTYHYKDKDSHEIDMKTFISPEHGMRADSHSEPNNFIQVFGNPNEKTIVAIIHSTKTYTQAPLSDEQLAEFEFSDPKEAIKELLSVEHKELGRRTINGIEAEGIEITDPAAAKSNFEVDSLEVKLWVAVETGLPILCESITVGNNGNLEVHSIQDEFQWNVELDESVFEPDIPEDYTQTGISYSQEGEGTKLRKWRFKDKDSQRGYLLESEDGQATTNIPESWADDPEHAVRVKEELDLQKRQGNRKLVAVTEIEVNGQIDYRILLYEHNLSDGQTIKTSDFDPDDPSQWTVIGERQEELNQLLRERRRQEEKGQEIATTEERQLYGRVFAFKKRRFVLSDGTEVIHSIGRLKGD